MSVPRSFSYHPGIIEPVEQRLKIDLAHLGARLRQQARPQGGSHVHSLGEPLLHAPIVTGRGI